MSVSLCGYCMCVQVPSDARGIGLPPWSWSSRWFWDTWYGCRESNLCSLQRQYVYSSNWWAIPPRPVSEILNNIVHEARFSHKWTSRQDHSWSHICSENVALSNVSDFGGLDEEYFTYAMLTNYMPDTIVLRDFFYTITNLITTSRLCNCLPPESTKQV